MAKHRAGLISIAQLFAQPGDEPPLSTRHQGTNREIEPSHGQKDVYPDARDTLSHCIGYGRGFYWGNKREALHGIAPFAKA
jgi:hypothetical protein